MDGDWIKLYRKLGDNPIMKHAGLCHLWIFCLMKANWKPLRWLIPGTLTEIEVPRGSFITGRESLRFNLYPPRDKDGHSIKHEYIPTSRTIWNWLKALERMECVKLKTVSSRCTILTICNYCTYQDVKTVPFPGGFQVASSTLPGPFQVLSTSKEDKEIQEEEESKEHTEWPSNGHLTNRENEEAFSKFWNSYPRKANQPLTRHEWDMLSPTKTLVEEIMAGLDRWHASAEWERKMINYPNRWLQNRRWKETPDIAKREETLMEKIQRLSAENKAKKEKES